MDSVKTPLTQNKASGSLSDPVAESLVVRVAMDNAELAHELEAYLLAMARQSVEGGEAVAWIVEHHDGQRVATCDAELARRWVGEDFGSKQPQPLYAAPPPAAAVKVEEIAYDLARILDRHFLKEAGWTDAAIAEAHEVVNKPSEANKAAVAAIMPYILSRLSPDTQGGAGEGQDVVEAAPIIRDWIRDDAPLALKMIITPALVDALANRLRAALTAGSAEG